MLMDSRLTEALARDSQLTEAEETIANLTFLERETMTTRTKPRTVRPDKYAIITPPCPWCDKPGSVMVSASEYLAYNAGEKVQDAMPNRSADFREQLISGTHPACWDEMFADVDDDESDCPGHPDGPVMGETFYCDGTCR